MDNAWLEENVRKMSSTFICPHCQNKVYYPQPTRTKGWVKHCPYVFCPFCGEKVIDGNGKLFDRFLE